MDSDRGQEGRGTQEMAARLELALQGLACLQPALQLAPIAGLPLAHSGSASLPLTLGGLAHRSLKEGQSRNPLLLPFHRWTLRCGWHL